MVKNAQKWLKKLKKAQKFIYFLIYFWHFEYIMIFPSFFQCFSAVNENLAGKNLNVQENMLPPDPEICKFWEMFFLFSGKYFFK